MARRRYVDGPFGQIHLREAGRRRRNRPSLICLHLSPMSSRIYEHFIDAIAERGCHALALDNPGFGMSDPPAHPPGIADYTRSLLGALEALDLHEAVDLMGYHTGSMIAADCATRYPSRVRRLTLVSAPIFSSDELEQLRADYAPVDPAEDGSHLTKRWRRFAAHYLGRGLGLEDAAELFVEGLLGGRREWWGHRAAFAFPPGMMLDMITKPTLVLNTDDDLRPQTERARGVLRNGRVVDLDGWGHGFLDTHTEAAADLVSSYLEAAETAPFDALRLPSE